MKNMDANDLESALNSAKESTPVQPSTPAQPSEANVPQLSPEEEVGFHKGALNTLSAERNELMKMIGNVEVIMQAHLKRLKELGVEVK